MTLQERVFLKAASRGLTKLDVPGNIEFVSKKGGDREIEVNSGTVKDGVRYMSELEVISLLNPEKKSGYSSAKEPLKVTISPSEQMPKRNNLGGSQGAYPARRAPIIQKKTL